MKRVSLAILIFVFGLSAACAPTTGTPTATRAPGAPLPTWTAAPPLPTSAESATPRPQRATRTPLPPGAPTRTPRPTVVFAAPTLPSGETQDPPQEYALTDVTMTLARTVCFGRCPAYSVAVNGDGSVNYDGRDFVKVFGTESKQISRDDVVRLLREFYEIDFFRLRSEYIYGHDIKVEADGTVKETQLMVTDLPTTIVTLTIGTYEKRVRSYYGAPEKVLTLAEHIDEVAGTDEWVR